MSVFTGNSEFRKPKKKTLDVYRTPKNTREVIPIAEIYKDGIFAVEPEKDLHLFDKAYTFSDINYLPLDDAEKEAFLENKWIKVLNLLNVDWKIVIANEIAYIKDVQKATMVSENTLYTDYVNATNDWIQDGLEKGNPGIRQVRYLVVTVRKNTYEEAKLYFGTLEGQLDTLYTAMKSNLRPLSAEERLKSLQGFYCPGKAKQYQWSWGERGLTKRNWKNAIAPADIESHKDYMVMDGTYVSVLFAREFPNSLDESKIMNDLTSVPFPSLLTCDVAYIPKKAMQDKLRAAHVNNEKSISQEQDRRLKNKNYANGISYFKQKKKEELEDYMDQVEDNDENGYYLSLLMAVYGNTLEELDNRVSTIEATANSLGIYVETYNHKQLKAYNTALPIGARQVNLMRSMLTSSMVAFHPFHAADLIEPGGDYYGTNRNTKNVIIGDRKRLKNTNGIIVGHTGSGKSMLIKLTEVNQTMIRTEEDIIIIDPQNEFRAPCERFGGEFIDMNLQSKIGVNPFEIPEQLKYSDNISQREEFIGKMSTYAKALCYAAMTNITPTGLHNTVIDLAIKKIYHREFEKAEPKNPSIVSLYEEIAGEDSMEAKQIAISLRAYTENTIFTRKKNLDIHNRFVVFGLQNCSEEVQEIMMVTIMHILEQRVMHNQSSRKATHFIIDEGQKVCKNEYSAQQLCNAFLTYRKYGGICTLAMQNVTAAMANQSTLEMMENCEMKIFLDQGGSDRNALASIMELSAAEFASLSEDIPGRYLMVWGKKVLQCDCRIEKDNPLYQMFQTSFHED